MSNEVAIVPTTDRLARLGFTRASKLQDYVKKHGRKMMIAYEHYRFVRYEKIQDFNKRLRAKTANWDGNGGYQYLELVPIADYPQVPPEDVLVKLEEAVGRQCFDSYEVAHIKTVPDPILFGRVENCADYFVIAQWDLDIRVEDLLAEHEG